MLAGRRKKKDLIDPDAIIQLLTDLDLILLTFGSLFLVFGLLFLIFKAAVAWKEKQKSVEIQGEITPKLQEEKLPKVELKNHEEILTQHDIQKAEEAEHRIELQRKAKEEYELARQYRDARAYKIAAAHYRESAELGYAEAQYQLAGMYHVGLGVNQDDSETLNLYQKAAEQGHAWGQYELGMIYEDGFIVQQDYEEALKWYRKAAKQGCKPARKKFIALRYNFTNLSE